MTFCRGQMECSPDSNSKAEKGGYLFCQDRGIIKRLPLFGVVQNWEDGYLKNTLHATINESYHRRMFIRESADKLLSYYLIHNRKALDNYLCYNCV